LSGLNGKYQKAEGILASAYGFDTQLPLTSWADIFRTLKSYDLHVIVENINKDTVDFWIGEIKRVTDTSVGIHNYDASGKLDPKPQTIRFDTISIVQFGDAYSTIFRKYIKG
jgi:hypothetical protein